MKTAFPAISVLPCNEFECGVSRQQMTSIGNDHRSGRTKIIVSEDQQGGDSFDLEQIAHGFGSCNIKGHRVDALQLVAALLECLFTSITTYENDLTLSLRLECERALDNGGSKFLAVLAVICSDENRNIVVFALVESFFDGQGDFLTSQSQHFFVPCHVDQRSEEGHSPVVCVCFDLYHDFCLFKSECDHYFLQSLEHGLEAKTNRQEGLRNG
mmetsp:Transcript_10518/g.22433  ORF Transcript_10518/g.22433 Transcript_10518/m.22433 type:complete len:213 (+) Transcript_10518:548-1186(+)